MQKTWRTSREKTSNIGQPTSEIKNMAKYNLIFDGPDKYFLADDIYRQGNAPAILTNWIHFLKERKKQISELYISLPQFNNVELHEFLKTLAASGIQIKLVTRPIKTFSAKDFFIPKDLATGQLANDSATTAYACARPIFAQHYKHEIENFNLHLFPHLNIRSATGNPFAALGKHYSLKLNCFLALYKNGGGAIAQSSASLAVGFPVKNSQSIIVEEDWTLLKSTHRFFQALIKNSIPVKDFDFEKNYNELLLEIQSVSQDRRVFFTAPFIKASTTHVEEVLTNLIKKSKQRIYIFGKNINAYEYLLDGSFHTEFPNEVEEHFGFLRPVVEMAAAGVEVKCLSKNKPTDAKAFLEVIPHTANIKLATNPTVNFSFMIVDELLVISSGDWSVSDFIYLDDVQIEKFEENREENFMGVFAALSMFLVIREEGIVRRFLDYFLNHLVT